MHELWRNVLSTAPCRVTSNHPCHHSTAHVGTSPNGNSQVHGHRTHGDRGHNEVHSIHTQLSDAIDSSVHRAQHGFPTDPRNFRDLYTTPTE